MENEVMNTEVNVEEAMVEELEALAACESNEPEEKMDSKVGIGVGLVVGGFAAYGVYKCAKKVKKFADGKIEQIKNNRAEKKKAKEDKKKSKETETEIVDAEVTEVVDETEEKK